MAAPAAAAGPVHDAPWLDSNVVLYVFSADDAKADRAEALLQGAVVGVQGLNECANVARRKFGMSWLEVIDALSQVKRLCNVRDLTLAVHEEALRLVERYRLAWFDALQVAGALEANCSVLYSEDMHHGLKIDGRLTIRNPFRGGS